MNEISRDELAAHAAEGTSSDGVDRRGFLKCMAWAGTGLVWSFAGGVPVSRVFGELKHGAKQADFSFIQISDSHIGFNKAANTDVTATLQAALEKINGYSNAADFLIHTGDLTHSAKAAEFDMLEQVTRTRRGLRLRTVYGRKAGSISNFPVLDSAEVHEDYLGRCSAGQVADQSGLADS